MLQLVVQANLVTTRLWFAFTLWLASVASSVFVLKGVVYGTKQS